MEKIVSVIVILLILGYVIYCEFFRSYTEYETKIEYITVRDTLVIHTPTPYKVEVPVEVEIPVLDTLWLKDTVYIKEFVTDLYDKYNTKNYYSNVLDLDTLGIVTVESIVFQNRLERITFYTDLQIPKYTLVPATRNWGIGLMGGYKAISPTFLHSRNKMIYIGNYNVIRNEAQAGVLIRF